MAGRERAEDHRVGPGELPIAVQAHPSRHPDLLLDWQGSGVGYVDTLSEVSTTGFTLVSGNAADNYYVNWLAVANNT